MFHPKILLAAALVGLASLTALTRAQPAGASYFRTAEPHARLRIESRTRQMHVKLTAYNAVPGQTDGDPGRSACGPTVPNQVAVSPDLRAALPCGTYVSVTLPDGREQRMVVNDATASRKRNQIDILMATRDQAMQFGVRRGAVTVND